MPTIMISIMPDGIPVDKMDEDDNGSSCPIATQDEEVNDVNKMYALCVQPDGGHNGLHWR